MSQPSVADLLREARRRAACRCASWPRRAGTAQSVIARIEGGTTMPTRDTLARPLAAAGFAPQATLAPAGAADFHMLDDVPRILSMTPEQRLIELRNVSRLLSSARRVG